MQWNSSPRRSVRSETSAINVELFAAWRPFFSVVRDVSKRSYALLRDHRKLKWILTILVTFISLQIYFVRELLAGLFFFTIFYVISAALAVLYILIVDALDCGSARVTSRTLVLILSAPPLCIACPSAEPAHGSSIR